MSFSKMFSILLAVVIASACPSAVSAAPMTITASIQSSLDKTIAAADRAQANKINSLYNDFLTLQKQEQDLNAKIQVLRKENKETLTALNQQIKQIDKAKIDRLTAQVTQTRELYKPLLSQYTSLNKQIEAARLLKQKELGSLLRFQASLIKIPVQLARMDIKVKEDARLAAKSQTAKTVKKIRGSLADLDPVNAQIKAKQETVKTVEGNTAPVWSTFKQVVKNKDSSHVLTALGSLVTLSRQINEQKQQIYSLELKNSGILSAAKKQIP